MECNEKTTNHKQWNAIKKINSKKLNAMKKQNKKEEDRITN